MLYRFLILITKLAVNAIALLVVTSLFKGIGLDSNQATIAAAVVLVLVNTYLRPLVVLLTLPINVLTLGLFTLVINALMLELVSWVIPAFHIDSFWTAVGAALVISIISFLLNWFLRPGQGSSARGALLTLDNFGEGSCLPRSCCRKKSRKTVPVCDLVRATCAGRSFRHEVAAAVAAFRARSMTQSASAMMSRLCSIITTVLPASTKRCNTRTSFSTSAICNPMVGSSSTYSAPGLWP